MQSKRVLLRATLAAVLTLCALGSPASAQVDAVPVPEQMRALDFMVGEWSVNGAFRNPDHVGADRTLWYTTHDGGVTRFDGRSWVAFAPGDSVADSVMALIPGRADPYPFESEMTVRTAQDEFMLVVDEGRTSGTTFIYFDTGAAEWVATSVHAASNSVTSAGAADAAGLPVFEGRGTDRRGERIFRRQYEVHGPDHFSVRTDVSFDEGQTWIADQIVQEVRRR